MLKTDLIAPVCALLRRQASERPTRMAFRDAHSSLDYATLERSTALLASQLQAAGLAEGESVALMLPNSVAGVLASEPPNLPTAVRAAATMTMSSMMSSFFMNERI